MQVKNEADWLKFQADLARDDDPEVAANFLQILEEWATLAERQIEQYFIDCSATASESPVMALRETLGRVEQNHGTLSGLWIYEMLVLLDANWIHGGDLYEALSAFEKHSYSDVARAIIRTAQQDAQTAGATPQN